MDRATSPYSLPIDLSAEPRFQLGPAWIDPSAHECTIGDKAERIQPQTLKVLVALHDRSGRVVTRDQLTDRCWDGRVVGEDVINRCISLLRRMATDNGCFKIETVPRAGYRLVETAPRSVRKHTAISAAAVAVAIAGLFGWIWLDRPAAKQGAPPAPVITVIPFSADSTDPAALQVARAAPVSLSHMLSESGLPIILADSRSKLPVKGDFVISGNVSRNGNALEATVQMNSIRDGTMAYSHDFHSPANQAADLPDRIGALIAAELAWTGAEMVLDRRHPLDPQVASELMKAISLTIERGDILRAYQIERHVAPLAPNSAIAQLSLAVDTGFAIDSIPRDERPDAVAIGLRAGDRARALAPEFGDVSTPWCLLHSPVRMLECEGRLRKAMQIDPSTSFVPGYISSLLFDAGRIDESVELARVSLANDPYKPAKLARMIRMFEASGDEADAASLFREATRLWPDDGRMRAARLMGLAEQGNDRGFEQFENAAADAGMIDSSRAGMLFAAKRKHDLPLARRACAGNGLKRLTLQLCMTTFADLGDLNGSYRIAGDLYPKPAGAAAADEQRAWLDHPDGFANPILSAPAGKAMRSDPRFLALAGRLGLLAYWRSGRLPDFCTKAHEPLCSRIAGRAGG